MTVPNQFLKDQNSYFHANSKLLKRETHNYLYNSDYKSGHIILIDEILSNEIPFYTIMQSLELDNWIINNPGIIKKYDKFPLTSLPGSSSELWYIVDDLGNGPQWIKPIILPELVTDLQNNPAGAYAPKLWKQDGVTQIFPSWGVWWIDPYQGCVRFGDDYNPGDTTHVGEGSDDTTDWGIPKLSCYAYIGETLGRLLARKLAKSFKYVSTLPSIIHNIVHNLGTLDLQLQVMVEDPISGLWSNDLVGYRYLDNNRITVSLTESCNVKVDIVTVPD